MAESLFHDVLAECGFQPKLDLTINKSTEDWPKSYHWEMVTYCNKLLGGSVFTVHYGDGEYHLITPSNEMKTKHYDFAFDFLYAEMRKESHMFRPKESWQQ